MRTRPTALPTWLWLSGSGHFSTTLTAMNQCHGSVGMRLLSRLMPHRKATGKPPATPAPSFQYFSSQIIGFNWVKDNLGDGTFPFASIQNPYDSLQNPYKKGCSLKRTASGPYFRTLLGYCFQVQNIFPPKTTVFPTVGENCFFSENPLLFLQKTLHKRLLIPIKIFLFFWNSSLFYVLSYKNLYKPRLFSLCKRTALGPIKLVFSRSIYIYIYIFFLFIYLFIFVYLLIYLFIYVFVFLPLTKTAFGALFPEGRAQPTACRQRPGTWWWTWTAQPRPSLCAWSAGKGDMKKKKNPCDECFCRKCREFYGFV